MMPAIGVDEKISQILSGLLIYREPDDENIRCAIDGILRLIKEEREDCAKIAEERELWDGSMAKEAKDDGKELSQVGHTFGAMTAAEIKRKIRARGEQVINPPPSRTTSPQPTAPARSSA